jgi:phosphate transport system substrate-binding protein
MRMLTRLFAAALLFLVSLGSAAVLPAHGAEVSGAGSTFVFPVLSKWAEAYKQATGITINYQSIGSGAGIKQIKAAAIDFGASDAPLDPKELAAAGLVQFPIVMGGVVPVVNVRGIEAGQLKLTGPVLADIYLGKITKWSDPVVAALNPGLALPDQPIIPIHRSDSSGTTFVFADYLAKVSSEWRAKIGASTGVEFPIGMGAKGSEGVAAFTASTNGAIGYIEYAYAKRNKLAFALVKNHAGVFVTPSSQSFRSAAANADWTKAVGFYMLLADQQGPESWPISGSTFVLVQKNQQKPGVAGDILKFFDWAYRNGSALADELDYVPITPNVIRVVEAAWAEIKEPDGKPAWSATPQN